MNVDDRLAAVIAGFEFEGTLESCEEIKTGHINTTYRLGFRRADGSERDYVLQRINTYVFKKPEMVMENVQLVTEHLRRALIARGESAENRVLRIIPVRGGGIMRLDDEGGCWRAYDCILHAETVDQVDGPEQFREIGHAFGEFQTMLADFPIEKLHDTIPSFHDTRKRIANFEASVARDAEGRAAGVQPEIAFARARAGEMVRIVDMIAAGEIPLRVTHNDTKVNNVMLDIGTGRAMCVIDLDTVMAGSALYDFGDAVRVGASTAAEDEADTSKVGLDIGLFRGFAEGFISQTAQRLTEAELVNLPLGALVMTYENGIRFLGDYLDGDVYYRIEYPEHNLVRARAQFAMVADMEAKRGEMDRIVRELIEKYR